MQLLSAIYGEVAWRRRLWYARRPDVRRSLDCPVVSVGSLAAGGSGKTPLAGHVARLMRDFGERPAVLSRGYRRPRPQDGVVLVRDQEAIRAAWDVAGDEPFMLARSLRGVVVLVGADRYLAGRLAERWFGCSVHLLDDGFQHLALERDIDLLVVRLDEPDDARVLPAGRLRERLETARVADALLVPDASAADASALAVRLGVPRAFGVRRRTGELRRAEDGQPVADVAVKALAVAGIARPERFFEDLERAGIVVAARRTYRDHHPYTAADLRDLVGAARVAGADWIVTTEKDLVRLLPLGPPAVPLAWLPLDVSIEPAEGFCDWLVSRLAAARREPGLS